jgi:hypothetical protein
MSINVTMPTIDLRKFKFISLVMFILVIMLPFTNKNKELQDNHHHYYTMPEVVVNQEKRFPVTTQLYNHDHKEEASEDNERHC